MTRTKLGFVSFVAARNCMRQQVAGRSSQRHATLPTYYKVVLRTEKVLLCTTLYYKVLIQYYSVLQSTNSVLLSTTKYYSVLQSTTPVLLCTTQYYSSTTLCYSTTTLYYKVLLQYYSVLQSTTPVQLCTTKYYSSTTLYYSSTTLYYKVLLQYYSVLQSATPVLVCTTKYYSSTTLMIDPRHIWNVIYNARYNRCHPPTWPNTAPATENDCHYCSSSHMKRYLQCAQQQMASSNITEYCACHEKKVWLLLLVTYETLFTMRGTTGVILQHDRILRLPRKMTVITAPRHIWNVIYNARNNRWHPPTSPNTVPATQNDCHDWSSSHMKRYLECAEQQMASSNITEYCACHGKKTVITAPRHIWNVIYNAQNNRWHPPTSPNTAPATQSDCHDWSVSHMKRYLQCAQQQVSSSNITEYCACHAKWLSWLILLTYETLFTMRGTTDGILQHHRILRLPRKMTVVTDPPHIWNVIYNARNNRWHPPTSPNTAPATQSDCHDWSSSHRKRFLQCGQQQMASSNITEYCACHAKWLSWLILLTYEMLFTMRGTTDGILQHHRILRLPRKMTVMTDPRHIWNVIYNARSNKCHCPNSPNTAPGTKNESHDWSLSHMKRYLQCAEQQLSLSKLTKYCACHEKWIS